MLISELDPTNLSREAISQLLFGLVDDGQDGDCIIVPGSSKCVEYRLPVAVEAYKSGRAPKVLFSGGRVWRERGQHEPEAVLMKRRAIEQGVPQADILVETRSLHTMQNVTESKAVLDRALGLDAIRRIVLVTAAFHMCAFTWR